MASNGEKVGIFPQSFMMWMEIVAVLNVLWQAGAASAVAHKSYISTAAAAAAVECSTVKSQQSAVGGW